MFFEDVRELVEKFGGTLRSKRRQNPIFDGIVYEYSASFNEDEEADEFLEYTKASSGREIDKEARCLLVYFSLPGIKEGDPEHCALCRKRSEGNQ